MNTQQAETLRKTSEELKLGIDQALAQRTPEQKQRELDELVRHAHRLLGKSGRRREVSRHEEKTSLWRP